MRSTVSMRSNKSIRYTPYLRNRKRRSLTNNHFNIWKKRINNYVYNEIGYNLDDLPDESYRKWFDEGILKPSNVYHIVLGNYYELYNLNNLFFC